jgi:hypothetical protein
MNCTLASGGRLAMESTAPTTWRTSKSNSTAISPLACYHAVGHAGGHVGGGAANVYLAAGDVVRAAVE